MSNSESDGGSGSLTGSPPQTQMEFGEENNIQQPVIYEQGDSSSFLNQSSSSHDSQGHEPSGIQSGSSSPQQMLMREGLHFDSSSPFMNHGSSNPGQKQEDNGHFMMMEGQGDSPSSKNQITNSMQDQSPEQMQQDNGDGGHIKNSSLNHSGDSPGTGTATRSSQISHDKAVEKEKVDNSDGHHRRTSDDSRLSEEPIPKKPCLEINIRKLLPDLEKHWKTVEEDPTDFTAWTYLLQYVDQENELLAAREAYDAFLRRYPYCYGYWKKYADYEKRRGSSSDCEQVFRRGLKAVSLSVDLWIHYLNYVKATHEKQPEYIRGQFDAAIDACGMEFRSDKLWEHYIHWEKENQRLKNVLAIFDQVISMPTQSHGAHFQHVKDLINQSAPSEILEEEELQAIIKQVDEKQEDMNDDVRDTRIRDIVLEKRCAMYKLNEAEISARWSFEEAIKRPYFHVKPLEKGQLKIWKEYLDFEIEKGNYRRIIILFERCLIACALYEEYWIKYAKFLQAQPVADVEKLRDVFTRASTIHHQKKPWINLHWASFEESQGNAKEVVKILENLEKQFPDSLHIQYRRINFERRAGNLSKCCELFQKYIQNAKNNSSTAHVTIKYARFLSEVMNDYESSKKILLESADLGEGTRSKALMALVDIGMQRKPIDIDLVLATFDQGLQQDFLNEQKLAFAHRKIEFLEDYSPDIVRIEKAQAELQTIAKLLREQKPTEETARPGDDVSKGSNNNAYQENMQQQGSFGQQYNQYGQGYSNWNSNQSTGYSNNSQSWSAYQGYYG